MIARYSYKTDVFLTLTNEWWWWWKVVMPICASANLSVQIYFMVYGFGKLKIYVEEPTSYTTEECEDVYRTETDTTSVWVTRTCTR